MSLELINLGQFKNLYYIKENFDINVFKISAFMKYDDFVYDIAIKLQNTDFTVRGMPVKEYYESAVSENTDIEITLDDINEIVDNCGIFDQFDVYSYKKDIVMILNVTKYYEINDLAVLRSIKFDKDNILMNIFLYKKDHILL